MGEKNKRWLPLEANPDYLGNLGLMTSAWQMHDIYGFDTELLAMVPRPVMAVLLLFPLTDKTTSHDIGEVKAEQTDVYFMKQTVGNACGTVGLLHAINNNYNHLSVREGFLARFYDATKDMTPTERASYLEEDEEIGEAHQASAQEGDTAPPPIDEKVNLHFVCFVHNNGKLYELDGRKDGPVDHGETTQETLLEDASQVAKKFMERDPDNHQFNIVALAKA